MIGAIILVVGGGDRYSAQAAYTCPGNDAATMCSAPLSNCDSDGDGIKDDVECNGLASPVVVTGYKDKGALPRSSYFDPTQKDLFVLVFQKLPGSWFLDSSGNKPADFTSIVSAGLTMTAHLYWNPDASAFPSDRTVVSGQKAEKVGEDTQGLTDLGTATQPTPLGDSKWGTPNGLDDSFVWSERIAAVVRDKCKAVCDINNPTTCIGKCIDDRGGSGLDAVIRNYNKYVVNHEIGHTAKLTKTYTSSYGGYHYASGQGTVMEQSVVYTNKNGKVTFLLPTGFARTDAANSDLDGY